MKNIQTTRPMMRNVTGLAVICALGAFAAASVSQAQIITFDDDASYDNNFAERANGDNVTRDAGGYLLRTDNNSSITTAIYNTAATGGSEGSGGTTINEPFNTFGGTTAFTVQADFYQSNPSSSVGGASFGFYVKAASNAAPTTGYLALFRVADDGADFRVWDSNSNPNAGGVGTALGEKTFSGTFAAATYYTLKLEVVDIGNNVQFTGSIWNQEGSVIATFDSITDTTSAVTGAGQVAFRWGNASGPSDVRVDNFGVTAIPEPSTYAAFGGVAALGLALLRRRKRG